MSFRKSLFVSVSAILFASAANAQDVKWPTWMPFRPVSVKRIDATPYARLFGDQYTKLIETLAGEVSKNLSEPISAIRIDQPGTLRVRFMLGSGDRAVDVVGLNENTQYDLPILIYSRLLRSKLGAILERKASFAEFVRTTDELLQVRFEFKNHFQKSIRTDTWTPYWENFNQEKATYAYNTFYPFTFRSLRNNLADLRRFSSPRTYAQQSATFLNVVPMSVPVPESQNVDKVINPHFLAIPHVGRVLRGIQLDLGRGNVQNALHSVRSLATTAKDELALSFPDSPLRCLLRPLTTIIDSGDVVCAQIEQFAKLIGDAQGCLSDPAPIVQAGSQFQIPHYYGAPEGIGGIDW